MACPNSNLTLCTGYLDQKRSAKGEITMKGCIAGHLFVYTPNKGIIMREYLCDCEEFLSCIKSTSKFLENKNSDTDDSVDCLLNE